MAPRTAQVASLLLLEGTVPLQPSAGLWIKISKALQARCSYPRLTTSTPRLFASWASHSNVRAPRPSTEDALSEKIAVIIIELATTGECDPDKLCDFAIEGLRNPPAEAGT